MDKEAYFSTLFNLRADCSSLECDTATLEHLYSIGASHPHKAVLTPEVEEAFDNLAKACEAYLAAHKRHL